MDETTKLALQKRWIHSHEEDGPGEMVLRPHTFQFPLSRGRVGYEFRGDGSYVDVGIGPADGPDESSGTWEVAEDDTLVLRCPGDPGRDRTLRVKSVGEDRLVVEP